MIDTDGDGVADGIDRCQALAGTASRKGCPSGATAETSARYRPYRGGITMLEYDVKAPKGARITVSCSRGCRKSSVTAKSSKPVRISRLNGKRLKNGARITVSVSLKGRLTARVVDRIRGNRRHKGSRQCFAPSTTKPRLSC